MRIYLDHNATTPLHPEVLEAMTAVLRDGYGNPSSIHAEGAEARARVESARAEVADLLGVEPGRVRFGAGASEANNTALRGMLSPGDHVVTSAVEHPSVVEPLRALERERVRVTRVAPDADGCVPAEAIEAALESGTRLVSLIWANNETGALQPVEAVARTTAARGIALHVDATQAVGKLPIDLSALPIDLLSCSAHKLGGPKGVGALVVPPSHPVSALVLGGGQERGFRGGTENVAGIVGFGVACRNARTEGAAWREAWGKLRDRLWEGLRRAVPEARWNADPARCLCNTLNVELPGVAGEVLVQALDLEGVAVSSGAACHSGAIDASPVLLAMGRTPVQARASLRFSIGHGVDEAAIERVVSLVGRLVPGARAVLAS